MTLTFELDLRRVKMNQQVLPNIWVRGHLVIVQAQTHTALITLPGPLKWQVTVIVQSLLQFI